MLKTISKTLFLITLIIPSIAYAHLPAIIHSSKEIIELKNLAENGDANAMQTLGYIYSTGRGEGIKINIELAIDYYERAISKGNILAQIQLGDIYLKEKNVQNSDKALALYKKAAASGSADGYEKLSDFYYNNYPLKLEYIKKAYELGGQDLYKYCQINSDFSDYLYYKYEAQIGGYENSINFANYLSNMIGRYDAGFVGWGNETSLEWLKNASDDNEIYGAYYLGEYYLDEYIYQSRQKRYIDDYKIPISIDNKNLLAALPLFELAAQNGDFKAIHNLPAIYLLLGKNELIEDAIRAAAFKKIHVAKINSWDRVANFEYYNSDKAQILENTIYELTQVCDMYDGKSVEWYVNSDYNNYSNFVELKLKKNTSKAKSCKLYLNKLRKEISHKMTDVQISRALSALSEQKHCNHKPSDLD